MFLKPIMLAGLGAAVIPLALHLLSKARYRSVGWGAMMFLDASQGRQRRGAKLKQAVLLLMRTAMIAALAIALARPVLRAGSSAGGDESHIHAIVILDRSASMGFEENDRPRMADAKQAVIHVLSSLHRGDEVSLILTGDPVDPGEAQPTTDLQAVANRVSALSPSFGKADFAAALEQAHQPLLREPNVTHEIYIVSDRQAISWQNVNERFAASWNQTVAKLGAPLRCFVIPVGGEERDNLAIESIRVASAPVIRSTPVKVAVNIRNYGPIPRSNLPVTILAGGQTVAQASANIPPDGSTSLPVWLQFPSSGSQVLSARLTSTGLREDDEIDAAVDVLESVRVLIISNEEHANHSRSAADYLRLALAPHEAAGVRGVDPAAVRRISVDDWWGISPDRDDVVILPDIGQLTDDQTRQLEQFVYGGGGMIVAPGNATDVEHLNDDLYRDGEGFLPASFKSPGAGASPTTLRQVEFAHSTFAFLADWPRGLPDTPITRSLEVDDRAPDERVLATFSNGQPFLIERPYGRGRVLMFTTSLGTEWNSLPTTNFYLPLVQSCVRYLAGVNLPDRNLKPGEPIELSFDHAPAQAAAIVTLPSGQQRRVQIAQTGQRFSLRFTETSRPGRYVVSFAGANPSTYVVQAPRDESDPMPLPQERWDWLENVMHFSPLQTDEDTMGRIVTAARTGRELHLPLIWLVFGLSLCEMGLARWWSGRA